MSKLKKIMCKHLLHNNPSKIESPNKKHKKYIKRNEKEIQM